MRLFIGIEIPPAIKQNIHEYLSPIQRSPKGWENPHDYHQTLLFIGEVSQEKTEDIIQKMRSVQVNPFHLTSSDFKFFSRRILYLAFEPNQDLLDLKKKVEVLFPELPKATKGFIPHITVKRWQRYEYDDIADGLSRDRFQVQQFWVNHISLFKSEKDSANRKYHVIFKHHFKKS